MWFRQSSGVSPIYTPREFRQLLDRECRRADRYRSRFSLAVFEVGTSDENSVLIRRLVRTMHNRFRRTDELGWYSRRELGVMLPFTPAEGAWKVAEYVSEIVAAVTSPPAFTIYTYPSDNWPRRTWWQRLFGPGSVGARLNRLKPIGVSRPDDFHSLIVRERARADRNGHNFSLLVFRLSGAPQQAAAERRLVSQLNERLRDTDEMGWYDPRHVGAILPYVIREDAEKIADALCRTVFGEPRRIYTVYTYPDSWFPGDDVPTPFAADRARASAAKQRLPLYFPDGIPQAAPREKEALRAHAHFIYRPMPRWKRMLDVAGSALLILLLSPVLLAAAAWIRLVSRGPVLFRQERVGYMRWPFTLFKFRTMPVNVDTDEHLRYVRKLIVEDKETRPMTKLERPQTLIPGGRVLRAACVDELPQLFNVLRGDMSLVGPRPCLPYEAEEYLRWHAQRFDSVPGMTGLWQVRGKNRTTFQEMIRYDISYERNRSPLFDLKILFLTPWAILKQVREPAAPSVEARRA
ncbi:MAG: sugar transferase [Lentisphaerae bacterium]|nr:sugar transferase [Lentisphaerota bacterium]